MNNIIGLASPLFALILLGMVAGKIVPDDRRGLVWLNILVFYFALPALVFRSVANAPLEEITNWSFVVGTTLSTYIVFILMFLVAVLVGRVGVGGAALRASAASYANVGYIGVPLAAAIYGDAGALPAALILCFDTLLQFTVVPLLNAQRRREDGRSAIMVAIRSIALNPLIIAFVLGGVAAATRVEIPDALGFTIDYLADGAAPAALFAIGVTVARQDLAVVSWDVPVIAFVKLIVHPAVALLVLVAMGGFDPVWISVAVMLAALPTAANVFVMANQLEVFTQGSSNAVLVTTLVSLVTVSGVVALVAGGNLPVTVSALFF